MNIKSALYRSINQVVNSPTNGASSYSLVRMNSNYKINITLKVSIGPAFENNFIIDADFENDKNITINKIYLLSSAATSLNIRLVCYSGEIFISSEGEGNSIKIENLNIKIIYGSINSFTATSRSLPPADIITSSLLFDKTIEPGKIYSLFDNLSLIDSLNCDNISTKSTLYIDYIDGKDPLATLSLDDEGFMLLWNNRHDQIFVVNDTAMNLYRDLNLKGSSNINFTSDRRLKTNITPVQSSLLEGLLNTEISTFNYTSNPDATKSIGLMAQDIEINFPQLKDQLVTISEENGLSDKRSIKETKLVYVLWKALQEEAQKRKELEDKVEKLIKLIESKL